MECNKIYYGLLEQTSTYQMYGEKYHNWEELGRSKSVDKERV